MYDSEALRRKIAKDGITKTIEDLSSTTLSPNFRKELEDSSILVNGSLNFSLIFSLNSPTIGNAI